jgi:hypothetical protein
VDLAKEARVDRQAIGQGVVHTRQNIRVSCAADVSDLGLLLLRARHLDVPSLDVLERSVLRDPGSRMCYLLTGRRAGGARAAGGGNS